MKAIAWVAAVALAASLGAMSEQDARPSGAPTAVVRLDPALDEVIAPDAKLELIREDLGITEGPVWVPEGKSGHLVFTDIAANVIYRMNMDGRFSILVDRKHRKSWVW